jgi:hypothetical protein
MNTPIYDHLNAEAASTVVIPDDARRWTDDDHLTVADAPAINGTADQAGGLTL